MNMERRFLPPPSPVSFSPPDARVVRPNRPNSTSSVGAKVFAVVTMLAGVLASLANGDATTSAAEPLHRRLDALVLARAGGEPLAPPADDDEFVRRIYLDLAGRIPSWHERQAFLDDRGADKRSTLIDKLLTGADYPRRMQELFTAMLLERRGDNPEWGKFLRASFEQNKPWDQLAREIVDPDPENEATRGAAFFQTKRLDKNGQEETDYPGLTRDVGRLFLGMDLQCAQCHNHLFIDDYKQQDFQGLFIAFQNTFIRTDLTFPAIGEKPIAKKIEFMSVFDKVPLETGPKLPGAKELELPQFDKGQEYLLPPDRKTKFPGVPRFSALEALAREMSTPRNRAFVDNIANRLWFVMMGRGLVNPLDQQHAANPPSHPDVLELLGREFVEQKFDVRWLLGELARSQTYQRSSRLPTGVEAPKPETYRTAGEKHLSGEQICWSVLVATGPRTWSPPDEKAAKPAATPMTAAAPTSTAGAEEPKKTDASAATAVDLTKLRAAFVKAFANPPKDPEVEFAPSLKAALFVMNDGSVLELLAARSGNLIERLTQAKDGATVADELYRSVLTRSPTDEEKTTVAEYLQKNEARRPQALADLAWALLASTEFCINH